MSKRIESGVLKKCVLFYVYCSIIHNGQDTETTQIPIIGWVNKANDTYTHMEYYSDWEKERKGKREKERTKEILLYVTLWMKPEVHALWNGHMLSETSQSQKNKYSLIALTGDI